ncbi:MAG TPA: bifunctional 2-C-methyl-D-erythritol 4-phosphate cytidylyltransferase/2-C-methyl-D-erythritol 2,4-cyclodiphosphate synthase [Sphingobium sp.]|nr:bifunctional 2-C-methyl-D-erythritol 4-phosphate cytidylyltransferase/2-C-methyl-D-erythritol 2,4-cyclodiphosphate synthase [Sphingobium sp.]
MKTIERLAAMVLAAGKGERAGGTRPKQYARIAGRSVLGHALQSLGASARVSETVLVIGAGEEARVIESLKGVPSPHRLVTGGTSRQESVSLALADLASRSDPPSHVLVHDGARPFVPSEVLDRLVLALEAGAVAAIPVLPVADTLVRGKDGRVDDVVPRESLFRVQTPQAFRFDVLSAAHAAWPMDEIATDDAQMVRALGHDVTLVPGDQQMEKITLPEDFARVAALNGIGADIRTGTGFDVHRLEEGRPLWLCGIEIAHSHGLSGHSDADVAIHALVDALLGALGEGDIGAHFPPSDPEWRGAPSARFLEFARERVAARNGRILHVDLTIICEAPKIGPHRDSMRARLAEILSIEPDRVSVKATTTEGLGFTGRREGIAAQALVTINI